MSNLLPFHPLADMFPLIEGKDFDDLVADIKQNGLREEISSIIEKDGREVIVDGRNRYRACLKAGVEPKFRRVRFKDEAGLRAYIISQNIHRRHLSREWIDSFLAELIKQNPDKSDRALADEAKKSGIDTSHMSVRRKRKKMKASGVTTVTPEKRVGLDGKRQPAAKPKTQTKAELKTKLPVPPPKPDVEPAKAVAASLPKQPHAEELDALRTFVKFTVMNVDTEDLKLTGDPDRIRRWKDLRARVAPFVNIGV
jgi:ParB-like chromosome segregation protein Spo0J